MLGVLRAGLLSSVAFVKRSYADAVNALNPVAYWHLGEAGGPTIVDEKAVQDGTYVGSVEFGVDPIVENSFGTAAGFDGANAYGQIPHDAAFAFTSYTVDLAFQADTTPVAGSNRVLWSKDKSPSPAGGTSIEIYNDGGTLELRAYAGGASGASWIGSSNGVAPLNLNVAYKVTLTVSSTEGARLYLNGVEVASAPANTTGWQNNSEPIVIAAYSAAALGQFDGVIDEVAVFDRRLTGDQIASLAQPRTITHGGPDEVTLTNAARSPSADPPAGATAWVAPGGTASFPGTQANPMGSIAAAINGASAGAIIAVQAGSGLWDYTESGQTINGKSGTQANPIKVIGYGPRRVRVDNSIKKFRGGTAGSPLSVWTQQDAPRKIWRSSTTGLANPLHGFMDAADERLRLITYSNDTAFESNDTFASDDTPYCGPGLRYISGEVRIRMEDGRYVNEIYGGSRPVNKNPNQNDIVVNGSDTIYTLTNCSWIEFHYIDVLYSARCWEIGNCHHIIWEDCEISGNNKYVNVTGDSHHLTWSHVNSFYGLPHYLAWNDWKVSSPQPTPYNAHGAFQTTGNQITNLKWLDCVFRGDQQPIWCSDRASNIEVGYCSFLDNRDDPIVMSMSMGETEIHHNYYDWCAWAIGKVGGGETNNNSRGPWYVHHNIMDLSKMVFQRRQSTTVHNLEPAPGSTAWINMPLTVAHMSQGSLTGDPHTYKYYYNTILYGKDDDGIYGVGMEYQNGWNQPTTRAASQERFNNIQVCRWNWNFLKGTNFGKHVGDGNVYHRPGSATVSAFQNLVDKNGNSASFSSLAALQASTSMTNGLFYNPLEGASLQVDPLLKGGAMPFARGEASLYWPQNPVVQTGAVDITAQGWPGATSYQAARGALASENAQVGPRPASFASF